MSATTTGQTLRSLREELLHVSQSKLAAWAGLDHTMVNRLEADQRTLTRKTAEKLVDVYRAEFDEAQGDYVLVRMGFLPDRLATDVMAETTKLMSQIVDRSADQQSCLADASVSLAGAHYETTQGGNAPDWEIRSLVIQAAAAILAWLVVHDRSTPKGETDDPGR